MEVFLLVVAVVSWVLAMRLVLSEVEPPLASPMPYSVYFDA